MVLLDTTITDALRRKGMAREVVSKIQAARKALDLAFDARVKVSWAADGELAKALEEHAAYVAGEVLATSFVRGAVGDAKAEDVDGQALSFAVTPV